MPAELGGFQHCQLLCSCPQSQQPRELLVSRGEVSLGVRGWNPGRQKGLFLLPHRVVSVTAIAVMIVMEEHWLRAGLDPEFLGVIEKTV